MRVHNLLANGMGGLDWAGLPAVAEWLGVRDYDRLMGDLEVLLMHRPTSDQSQET